MRDPVAFDMATVNENASQQPPEPTGDNDINAPSAVAIEASVINQSISQVVSEAEGAVHILPFTAAAAFVKKQLAAPEQARFTASGPLPIGPA